MQILKPRILIADDHGMIRRGVSLLIQNEIGQYTIAEADSCAAVMSQLHKEYITHLILDMIFADGNALEILPNINKLYPSLKILIFSMQPAAAHGEAFRHINIEYYLSKTSDNETVVQALTHFLNDEKMIEEQHAVKDSVNNPFKDLTAREMQILHYMLNGLGTKQIAETLHLKMNSVSTYKKRIFIKTGTVNFRTLAELCMQHNIRY